MSNVENTMRFIDHASPSKVEIGQIDVIANNSHTNEAVEKLLESNREQIAALIRAIEELNLVVEPSKVEVNPVIQVEPPKEMSVNFPPISFPEPQAPQVNISLDLFNRKALAIIIGAALLQIAMIGALIWR